MIGPEQLAKMKKHAILINTARGGLVDEEALAEALKAGTIGGAGFDVVMKEPPKDGNILCELDLPNLIVTPHVAWASKEAMQILADQLVDNVEAFVAASRRTWCDAGPRSPPSRGRIVIAEAIDQTEIKRQPRRARDRQGS